MKPGAYDPMTDAAILLGIGSAHAVDGPENEQRHPAGRLYVPDPEARRGWREFYVQRPADEPKQGRRPVGFGR